MRTENLIHPDEILREEFMVPMGISQNKLAIELRIPATRNRCISIRFYWIIPAIDLGLITSSTHIDQIP